MDHFLSNSTLNYNYYCINYFLIFTIPFMKVRTIVLTINELILKILKNKTTLKY